MRSFFLVTMLLPLLLTAQINRSAKEFASEQVQEYVIRKLFKGQPYKPVSFGHLKEHKEKNNFEMAWRIEHKFEITAVDEFSGKKTPVQRTYSFLFYLDNKMKVLRADTYLSY